MLGVLVSREECFDSVTRVTNAINKPANQLLQAGATTTAPELAQRAPGVRNIVADTLSS